MITIVVAEVFLRLAFGLGNPLLLEGDADIGYMFQPNQSIVRFGNRIHINSAHQRCEDFTSEPTSNVMRILVVGDSVTFGGTAVDQDETITMQLQTMLHHDTDSPVEVLNASAGSWGLGNELAYIERFGVFGSRWVVLQIGSHDLLQKKSTSQPVGVHPAMPDKRPLLAFTEVWTRYLLPRLAPATPPDQSTPAQTEEQFGRNMDYLFRELMLVRQAGARPLILHTPERDEVVDSGSVSTNYCAWREKFFALADEEGVHVIDLSHLWHGAPEAKSYFSDHVHLTKAGNAAVAGVLARVLESCEQQRTTGHHGEILVRGAKTAAPDLIAKEDSTDR